MGDPGGGGGRYEDSDVVGDSHPPALQRLYSGYGTTAAGKKKKKEKKVQSGVNTALGVVEGLRVGKVEVGVNCPLCAGKIAF